MSLNGVVNHVENTNRDQASRSTRGHSPAQDHNHGRISKKRMRDTFEGNSVDDHNTDKEDDELRIKGRAGLDHQSLSRESRNATYRRTTKRENDQSTEESPIGAKRPRIGVKERRPKKDVGRSAILSSRHRLIQSATLQKSDEAMDPGDASPDSSTDVENTQKSNSSSLPSHQDSSQTTQCSSQKHAFESRCSSPDLVRRHSQTTTTLIKDEPRSAKFKNIRIQGPRKRQHISSSPEPGEGDGPNQRKRIKSSPAKVASPHASGAGDATPGRSSRKTDQQMLAQRSAPSAPLVLSPSRSNIYQRRLSASPKHLPILSVPRERDQRIYRELSPQAPSPETNSTSFNIFTALLAHSDLIIELSKHFPVKNLVDLYAISKDYHDLADSRFTALVMAHAMYRAPDSARVFLFRAYRNLCKRDPAGRLMLFHISEKEGIERVAKASDSDVRFVPSFRWLKMILHHEVTVGCILQCLAREGHRLPKHTTLVIKKLWFTLDISDNGRRIGLLHDKRFWSNRDLFVLTMFFVKLDMRLTDPITGTGEMGLRKLLLAQKGLETLARVLARQELKSQLELVRMIVKFDYEPPRPLRQDETIFGIPSEEVGKLCYEGWGKGDKKLVPIDELIAREAIRRQMNLHNHYMDMMLYGYIDKRTFEDIPIPPSLLAMAPLTNDHDDFDVDEWASDDEVEEESVRLARERRGLFEGQTEDEDEGTDDQGDFEGSWDEQGFGL